VAYDKCVAALVSKTAARRKPSISIAVWLCHFALCELRLPLPRIRRIHWLLLACTDVFAGRGVLKPRSLLISRITWQRFPLRDLPFRLLELGPLILPKLNHLFSWVLPKCQAICIKCRMTWKSAWAIRKSWHGECNLAKGSDCYFSWPCCLHPGASWLPLWVGQTKGSELQIFAPGKQFAFSLCHLTFLFCSHMSARWPLTPPRGKRLSVDRAWNLKRLPYDWWCGSSPPFRIPSMIYKTTPQ